MMTWSRSHYNSWQLFGHHHVNAEGTNFINETAQGKMLNVNLEFNNYKMFNENDIVEIMEKKPDNFDLIRK